MRKPCPFIALAVLALLLRPGPAGAQSPECLPDLNGPFSDYSTTLSLDGRTIIATMTDRSLGGNSHLYQATRSNHCSPFGPISPVCGVNSGDSDQDPWLSHDGLRLYFASNRCSGGPFQCLFVASRPDPGSCFGAPVQIAGLENSGPCSFGGPTLTDDELTIFFTHNCPSNDADIWFATRASIGAAFGAAGPVPNINSAFDEADPEIALHGRLLLFESNRPGGAGAFDLWAAVRSTPTDPFDPPTVLPSCINSPSDDMHPTVSPDALELYFSSNRSPRGGCPAPADPGRLDIWRLRLGVTVNIPATQPWVNTGVQVSGGDSICLVATADWRPDPQQPPVGPMGRAEPCDPVDPACPIHANHGALVGRVAGVDLPFVAGDDFRFLVNQGWSGPLQLMINDATDKLGDNSGSATVMIRACECDVTSVCAVPLVAVEPNTPIEGLGLRPNVPNPFSGSTSIRFRLAEASVATLRVYDMAGRVIRTIVNSTPLQAGDHEARWDGSTDNGDRLRPGAYFYRLDLGPQSQARRMILVK